MTPKIYTFPKVNPYRLFVKTRGWSGDAGTQWWVLQIPEFHFLSAKELLTGAGSIDQYNLIRLFQTLSGFNRFGIAARPLSINPEETAVTDRNAYRGYDNDTDPFTYRGKCLPEIVLSHNPVYMVVKYDDRDTHTKLCSDMIRERFGPELLGVFADKVMARLLDMARKEVIAYAKAEVPSIRKQLTQLKALTVTKIQALAEQRTVDAEATLQRHRNFRR